MVPDPWLTRACHRLHHVSLYHRNPRPWDLTGCMAASCLLDWTCCRTLSYSSPFSKQTPLNVNPLVDHSEECTAPKPKEVCQCASLVVVRKMCINLLLNLESMFQATAP
jgi:hypothetical protein